MEATGQIIANNEIIQEVKYLDSSSVASISELNLTKVSMYPNPTSDYLTISAQNNLKFDEVKIYSISGKLINNFNYNKGSEISVASLKKGVYRIVLYNEKTKVGYSSFVKN